MCKNETELLVFCGLEVLEDQDLHRESAAIINSISKIQKIMQAAGSTISLQRIFSGPIPSVPSSSLAPSSISADIGEVR